MTRSSGSIIQEKLRRTTLYATLIISGLGLVLAARIIPALSDEAYIAFRYADMIVHGHGLRFNRFSAPIEGFTSPVWTAVLTLVDREAGANRLPTAAMLLGILSFVGCIALLLRLGRLRDETTFPGAAMARLLPALLWGLSIGAIDSSVTGTETVFFVLCILAIHGGLAGNTPRSLAILAALLIPWVRLEGLWVVVAGAVQLHFQDDRDAQLRRVGWPVLLGSLESAAVLEYTRHALFHAWWPSFVLAHPPSPAAGAHALMRGLSSPVVPLIFIAGAVGARLGDRLHRGCFLGAVCWLAVAVLDAGGPGPVRVLLPALALSAAAAGGIGRGWATGRLPRPIGLAAALAAIVLFSVDAFVQLDPARNPEVRAQAERESSINWFRRSLVSSLSLADVGEISFANPDMDVYDLNDRVYPRSRELIHRPRGPQMMMLRLRSIPGRDAAGKLAPRAEDGVSQAERAILADPRTKTEYRLLFVAKPEWAQGYARAVYAANRMPVSPQVLPASDTVDLGAAAAR